MLVLTENISHKILNDGGLEQSKIPKQVIRDCHCSSPQAKIKRVIGK